MNFIKGFKCSILNDFFTITQDCHVKPLYKKNKDFYLFILKQNLKSCTKQACSATSIKILLHLLPTFVADIQNFNLKRLYKLLPNSIDV